MLKYYDPDKTPWRWYMTSYALWHAGDKGRDQMARYLNSRAWDVADKKLYSHLAGVADHEGIANALINSLNAFGDRQMAVCFLNSGNSRLRPAAEAWAKKHGHTVYMTTNAVSY